MSKHRANASTVETPTDHTGRHRADDNEHVFLVAFCVNGPSREEAELRLTMALPRPEGSPRDAKTAGGIDYPYAPDTPGLECWWVAEDDRHDRSDNDSAIFVPRGAQSDCSSQLDQWFDYKAEEWRETGYPYAQTDVSGVWFRG